MAQITIQLPKPHAGQIAVWDSAKRFNVLALGRRWGKTTLGTIVCVAGYKTKDKQYKGIIQGGKVAWFAPNYRYLQEAWREIVHSTRHLMHGTANNSEHRATYKTGGTIEAWSLDSSDAGRGRKYDIVVIDEAAMVRNLPAAWQMSLRPTLADYEGGAWFLSTPKGLNFFHTLYQQGIANKDDEWKSWQMPTETNPYIPKKEVEMMRVSLPSRVVGQEVDALFLADGGGVFRRVQEAVDETKREYTKAHTYAMGVDWGRNNDYTVLTVINGTERRVEEIERFTGIGYELQTERLKDLARKWNVQTIVAESNSMGGPLVEQLQGAGLPVVPRLTTGESKTPLIEELSLAIERGELSLLPDNTCLSELMAYELQRLPSGRYKYDAPAGMHDDHVISLALAWQAVSNTAPEPFFLD